jgi:signal transduction histidine kinase
LHRPWQIAVLFGLCLAVVLAAMGWISFQALRLEADAHHQGLQEENVRLALWRMESALGPVVAQESAQPYFAYTAFYPVEGAYTRTFNRITQGEVLFRSPLLAPTSPFVLVHFQFDPRGELSSPQVPTGAMWSLAESGSASRKAIEASAARLASLKLLVDEPVLLAVLPRDGSPVVNGTDNNYNNNNDMQVAAQLQATSISPLQFAADAQHQSAANNTLPATANAPRQNGANPTLQSVPNSPPQALNAVAASRNPAFNRQAQASAGQNLTQPSGEPMTAPQEGPANGIVQQAVGANPSVSAQVLGQGNNLGIDQSLPNQGAANLSPQAEQQFRRNVKEYEARFRGARSQDNYVASNTANLYNPQMAGSNFLSLGDVRQGAMSPLWFGDALVLARRVTVNGEDYIQGAWLDWPALRTWLLDGVRDLVPEADLVPAGGPAADDGGRMLANIPARLIPGRVAVEPEGGLSPVALTLGIAWVCTLLAVLAVGVLLLGTVTLSERRGAFVSAVTHELRTPLTTFRMYSEMLSSGMVTDEAKRHRYLVTLRTEAERLTHLVENVLSYARIERGRARGRVEPVRLADLVTRTGDRLGDRARQAGMELVVEMPPEAEAATVRADASVVEQVLFNLVDNACKYAVLAGDKRIHLVAGHEAGRTFLKVCDHGPGIADPTLRRLFRPFSKSAADAAVSAPGVGLGLALSRRLAREMGGDLVYEGRTATGACFVLELKPVA